MTIPAGGTVVQLGPAREHLTGTDPKRHARSQSFHRYEKLSVPILPIQQLAKKRAKILQQLHRKLGPEAVGCIRLPSDKRCPRSFGNWQNGVVSALLTSHVLQAPLHASSPMHCNSLMQFKMGERLLPDYLGEARRAIELRSSDVCEWLSDPRSMLSSDECLILPTDHGQGIPWCLKMRNDTHSPKQARALFGLGPHVVYGAVLDAAFALPNETVPVWRNDELRISVHIRHFDEAHHGNESLDVFEARIRRAAAGAMRCAVLLASDRRLTLQLMETVVERVGCRLLQSARGNPVHGLWAEHGEDVGSVLLDDVWLLANGHVLIGTWGSTLTLAIQQLMAARSDGHPTLPTVTYCNLWRRKCLKPLPLLTVEENEWYARLSPSGGMHISSAGEMREAMGMVTSAKWARSAWAPFPTPPSRSAWPRTPQDWPNSDEAVAALQQYRWPAVPPPTNAFLGAIISRDTTNERYRTVASAVASCGFLPRHVPAAGPSDYSELGEMMLELFGRATVRAIRMSAFEIGLLISHKRALEVIAQGDHLWGGVFEDDAYLHEALSPLHTAHMLHRAFSAAGESRTVVYLGACAPQCVTTDPPERSHIGDLAVGLLRGGRCRGYCTHAYAVERSHATSFFSDVFDCGNGTSRCGVECESSPCYLDWAFNRHFTRGHPAWLLGGGLGSRWRGDHRGIFIQNRSAAGGNAVSGTSLSRRYKWNARRAATKKEMAARQRCTALVGNHSKMPIYVTARWTGRVGNLLFVTAGLMGVAAQLGAHAFAVNLPSETAVPAKELFQRLPGLTKHMQTHEDVALAAAHRRLILREQYRVMFAGRDSTDVEQCKPCKWTMEEAHANTFEARKLRSLQAWAEDPPEGCTLGVVELVGYFQSFRYFHSVADTIIRPALESSPTAQRKADVILASARRNVRSGILIGVQVRLGDKVRGQLARFYASTTWNYYRKAMMYLAQKLGHRGGPGSQQKKVAFIVTAGGTMNSSSVDVAQARKHLASVSRRITFSTADDPYVDLAVLQGCDGLVISSSSLGWWAAYLSRLPGGNIVAPRHTINPDLPSTHKLRVGFKLADYYPEQWLVLSNDGNGTIQSCSDEKEVRRARERQRVSMLYQLATKGLKLESSDDSRPANLWANKIVQSAFAAARKARARAVARAARVRNAGNAGS